MQKDLIDDKFGRFREIPLAIAHRCSIEFDQFPVTLMGGAGVGSDPKFMLKRLKEERLVQLLNAKTYFGKWLNFYSLCFICHTK